MTFGLIKLVVEHLMNLDFIVLAVVGLVTVGLVAVLAVIIGGVFREATSVPHLASSRRSYWWLVGRFFRIAVSG